MDLLLLTTAFAEMVILVRTPNVYLDQKKDGMNNQFFAEGKGRRKIEGKCLPFRHLLSST